MPLSWYTTRNRALAFSKLWANAEKEKSRGQSFIRGLLAVFGVEDPAGVGRFEYGVDLPGGKKGLVDYFWEKQIVIEMKSKGNNLKDAFHQLQGYLENLSPDIIPDLWLVSDFENINIKRYSTGEFCKFKTSVLHKHTKYFANIAGYTSERAYNDSREVNIQAAEMMAQLHDALKSHGYDGHDLEVYLVRLLFCLFADSTDIFPQNNFRAYVEDSKPDGSDLSFRLGRLFEVLDMSNEVRKKRDLISKELKQFRYLNGSLFSEVLKTTDFDTKTCNILIECAKFNWSSISPAIFGAMFQGVMDKDKRRELGAHYTSEENILKVINPLFLDDLWAEFERVKTDPKGLELFHQKIASLTFLDPACGCGNFLIVTYRELRLLELEILKIKIPGNQLILEMLVKVKIEQFYGIEVEEFPAQIAYVGMWLTDLQMNLKVSEVFGASLCRPPLSGGSSIKVANSLRVDWESVVAKAELSYILGNPPFAGGMTMTREQKREMIDTFGTVKVAVKDGVKGAVNESVKGIVKDGVKGLGELDYVSAWFRKAADYMSGTGIRAAFVSTNSITQGQQAITLWSVLIDLGININFAYRTFVWTNEAKGKAAVHCVIVGFSFVEAKEKLIFEGDQKKTVKRINPYLVDAPIVFVEPRTDPIGDAPKMRFGSMPRDGGWLVLGDAERDELLESEPLAEKWLRPYFGSREFINSQSRWCLWLVGARPDELRACEKVLERIEKVKRFRLGSRAAATRKFADKPALFCQIAQPDADYLAVPIVSSERRRYLPLDFLPAKAIASNLLFLIPGAEMYHFGVLTSRLHNVWLRMLAGRLKSDYRYSKDIVYNNFPWPEFTKNPKTDPKKDQKSAIAATAEEIIRIRREFYPASLADLYDPLAMPAELLAAHRHNDREVMKAYGFSPRKDLSDTECMTKLFNLYVNITSSNYNNMS
jgi:hypothetical protein